MTDSHSPHGFQWVDSGAAHPQGGWPMPSPQLPRKRTRRWVPWIVIGAVLVLAVGGVLTWRVTRNHGSVPAQIGTPPQYLIDFPLDRKPVQGWTISAADIGLPPGVTVGWMFASTSDKAYFVTDSDDARPDGPTGWVYGLDTRSGQRLFAPIELHNFRSSSLGGCYGNGLPTAVCLTVGSPDEGLPQLIWVLDLDRGEVTFTGPTDIEPESSALDDTPVVQTIGNHRGQTRLVAKVKDKGVYGVGPHGEFTWFVPGSGEIYDRSFLQTDDAPPSPIALQSPNSEQTAAGDHRYRVFSAVDGTDLTPEAPKDTEIKRAVVYNGGFAYSFHQQGQTDGLLFYDTTGKPVARVHDKNASLIPVDNSAMPIAWAQTNGSQWTVFTAAGEQILQVPLKYFGSSFKIIGTRLFISATDAEKWEQWDLQTGLPGPTCQMRLDISYVGSDGTVVISDGGFNSKVVQAIDTTTCTVAWELREEDYDRGLFLWKAGTGLLQRTLYAITQLHAAT